MNKLGSAVLWIAVAIVGAFAFAALALGRGEQVNAAWLVTAALSVYFIAYRFYGKFIAERVLQLDDARPTPAVRHNDGMDYVPTNKWVLYGHHFAAPARARWWAPYSPRRWASCRARCGYSRASSSQAPSRTSSCCSRRCAATANRSAR